MSGLKREDEYKLKELQQAVEDRGRSSLTEDDQLLLTLLEDRYARFLEEGLRKLRETAPSPGANSVVTNTSKDGIPSPRVTLSRLFSRSATNNNNNATTTSSTTSPRRADNPGESSDTQNESFGRTGSLSIVPPLQVPGKHWTWILDNLIIGAIPFAAQTPDQPGHLSELLDQCNKRRSCIAMVVSCLDVEEPVPAGFATTKDWETMLNTSSFLHISFIPYGTTTNPNQYVMSPLLEGDSPRPSSSESSAAAIFEEMLGLCAQVEGIIEAGASHAHHGETKPPPESSGFGMASLARRLSKGKDPRKKVAFVHCKAGVARSWVFAMCYLTSQKALNYQEADTYLRSLRAFEPNEVQIAFARGFAKFINTPRAPVNLSEDEEKYIKLLADVLSLPQKFRLKLLSDLEKLT